MSWTTNGDRDRRGLLIWACALCPAKWLGDTPGDHTCTRLGGDRRRYASLLDVVCPHLSNVRSVTVKRCSCGRRTVELGACEIFRRCALSDFVLDDRVAIVGCLGCEFRESAD